MASFHARSGRPLTMGRALLRRRGLWRWRIQKCPAVEPGWGDGGASLFSSAGFHSSFECDLVYCRVMCDLVFGVDSLGWKPTGAGSDTRRILRRIFIRCAVEGFVAPVRKYKRKSSAVGVAVGPSQKGTLWRSKPNEVGRIFRRPEQLTDHRFGSIRGSHLEG